MHAKQSTINSQNETIKQLNMEMSKYQLKLQEMRQEKSEWQSKTINSVRNMVEQQNTDTIIDQLTEKFELNESSKSIEEISQKIKIKYGSKNNSNKSMGGYLLILGVGVLIGYVFKDKIQSLLNQ